MTRRSRSFVLTLTLALLSPGCTSNPPQHKAGMRTAVAAPPASGIARQTPAPSAMQATAAPVIPASKPLSEPAGAYRATRVFGDYAGYDAVDQFIDRMAARHGFTREYLNGLFSQVSRKDWTLNYMARQAGAAASPRPGAWTRYRAQFLTEAHIAGGAAFWNRHAEALRRASERYGVPPEYIIGIMGVETIYGRNLGSHRIVDALTTLAFDYPRRGDYFAEELENFLIMTREEGIDPTEPVGSFAGAMGLGQFMPGSFLKWAVDFNRDGRRDLWEADDAVGSIANYFAQHGWRSGEPVVTRAVVTGSGVESLESGYDAQYSLAELQRYGIQPAGHCPDGQRVRLLRLRAAQGDEYWLGHENFYVITRYNHSTHYAMAVHELAQAVRARYLRG